MRRFEKGRVEKLWCVGGHCPCGAWDVELKVMVSSTLASSLSCLSLFPCVSILFSSTPSLSFLCAYFLFKNLAWSASLSSSPNLCLCVSRSLSFSSSLSPVYHPLADSCFHSACLLCTWQDVLFGKSGSSRKQNTVYI